MSPSRRLALLAVLATPLAAWPDSLRCEGGLVSPGATTLDLLAKCGAPAMRERQDREHQVLTSSGDGVSQGRRVLLTVEKWTYNFGSRAFLRFVVVAGGVVRSVATGGLGFDPVAPAPVALPLGRCQPLTEVRTGATTFEVLSRCGEPAVRDVKVVETMVSSVAPGTDQVVETWTAASTIDLWTYDFGPEAFIRRLEFRDGVLVRMTSGGYGYAAH